MSATTTQHINARNDPDLLDRFIAAAEQAHVDDASRWVQANMGRLVTIDVAGGQTIADVHAFAHATREAHIAATPPRPGADLAAVTDIQLGAAIEAVLPGPHS
ncbi:hypothetical protein D8M34_05805 [Microbacterium sp. HSID17254]|uniref:hypothetical protein n=1 Tax=Microbacterium sp. HSID17254 TaxID=2419509 RepID=UPI000F888634|nr:hypothetical protein [Microbacterium sp. HSID17254]RUQ06983.1 hypothetical protein D8M34_05805 [Microbacterium sp. HSID17254]